MAGKTRSFRNGPTDVSVGRDLTTPENVGDPRGLVGENSSLLK